MTYLIWFLKIFVFYPAQLLAFVLAPFACLFVKDGKLPKLFYWMQTFDVDIDEGNRNYFTPGGPIKTWWNRVRWVWRNNCQALSYFQLGIPKDGLVTDYRKTVGDFNKGMTSYEFWAARNEKGQGLFLFRFKTPNPLFPDTRKMAIWAGYEMQRSHPRAMFTIGIQIGTRW